MAKDVDHTLVQIIKEQAGFSDEETKAYVKELKKNKRYLRDVY
jgi:sulfite reductase (NADPH) flavoprotein alpha-component